MMTAPVPRFANWRPCTVHLANVRQLTTLGDEANPGTPDAPQHLLQVAISIDQLVEMLCAEFQAGS